MEMVRLPNTLGNLSLSIYISIYVSQRQGVPDKKERYFIFDRRGDKTRNDVPDYPG